MFRMKNVVGAVTLATLIGSSAFAAPVNAPLAPGKPAGVQKAALGLSTGEVLLALGIAGIIGAVVAVTTQTPGSQTGAGQTFSTATTAP